MNVEDRQRQTCTNIEREVVKMSVLPAVLFTVAGLLITASNAEICATPNSTEGNCVDLPNCPELKDTLIDTKTPLDKLRYYKKAQCGFSGDTPQVCCQTSTKFKEYIPFKNRTAVVTDEVPILGNRFGETNSAPKETCGLQELDNRIVDGTVTGIDEFPWMALLKYRTRLGPAILCGGVLISSRFVLTAAHCVTGAAVRELGTLENVTLGEYDLSTQRDCDIEWDQDQCVDQTVDVRVQAVYPHPNYNINTANRQNDIAVIRLMTHVDFTEYIQPICLPSGDIESKSIQPKNYLFISGWGSTKADLKSNIKLKAKVPITQFDTCSRWYKDKGISLTRSQICAGGEKKDACRGDSGGPLMYFNVDGSHLRWYVLGIISFGYKDCGTSGISSIYTKVGPYMSWINNIMQSRAT